MKESIAITGLGIVSSLGANCEESLSAMQANEPGVHKTEHYESGHLHGTVKNFKVADYIPPREARKMDPISCYSVAAGQQALQQAGLDEAQRKACGLLVGTGFSGLKSVVEHQRKFLRDGIEVLSPFHFPNTVYNASAGIAAIKLGVAGHNSTVTGVDVSGEQAIQYANMMLNQGMVEQVLVIGVDELSDALIKGFDNMQMLSQDTASAAVPYAQSSTGFNLSEGSAALLLETQSSALARGADILATIEGIGLCSSAEDSFSYEQSDHYAKQAITQALNSANQAMEDINWVSSSANGNKRLDKADAKLWPQLLQQTSTKIAALKQFTGEFAGSGVLRLALAIASSKQGHIPAMRDDIDYHEEIKSYLNFDPTHTLASRFLHHGCGIGGSQIAMVIHCTAA